MSTMLKGTTMHTTARGRDMAIVATVATIWTLIVIAFSTTMGARPLRIYDWGPPVFAALLTLCVMVRDKLARRRGG